MPKYIFSQGKVTAENGVYVPPRDKKHGFHEVVVLIWVQSSPLATENSDSTQDKGKEYASKSESA